MAKTRLKNIKIDGEINLACWIIIIIIIII